MGAPSRRRLSWRDGLSWGRVSRWRLSWRDSLPWGRLSWRGLSRRRVSRRRLPLWRLDPSRVRLGAWRRHRGRRGAGLRQCGGGLVLGRRRSGARPLLVLYRSEPAAGLLGRLPVAARRADRLGLARARMAGLEVIALGSRCRFRPPALRALCERASTGVQLPGRKPARPGRSAPPIETAPHPPEKSRFRLGNRARRRSLRKRCGEKLDSIAVRAQGRFLAFLPAPRP